RERRERGERERRRQAIAGQHLREYVEWGGDVEPLAVRLARHGLLPEAFASAQDDHVRTDHRPPDRWRHRLVLELYSILEPEQRSARATYRAISDLLAWFFELRIPPAAVKKLLQRLRRS